MSKITKFIDTRQFHKRNYDDAVQHIIPKLYFEEDYNLSKSNEIDVIDKVINSQLNIIGNFSSVIYVSAIPNSLYSSINSPKGIAQFFIKQNNLTDLDIDEFEKRILLPLNKSFRDFNSSSQFSEYILESLLPNIVLNKPVLDFLNGGAVSANHQYLITNLSWLYFLNFSGTDTYSPSSYVHDLLVSKIYYGYPIYLNDCIKGLIEYVWRNYSEKSNWQAWKLLPNDFRPPTFTINNYTTSGDQQLDRLKTLIDIVYSPLYIDNSDTRLKEVIDGYLDNKFLITDTTIDGPFTKLIKAFSFAFADYSNNVDKLESLYDIDKCPAEYLPLLADLIGWRLFGADPERWRLQLANAVNVYKRAGTKQSLQFAIDSIFSQDVFNIESKIFELWESYIPHLIYYSLATESQHLKDFSTWSNSKRLELNVAARSLSSMDDNIRLCTDRIIYELVTEFSSSFLLSGSPFPITDPSFIFNYRGATHKIPPFEEYPYYVDTQVTNDMVDSISDKLVCFGVPEEFSLKVRDYIKENCLTATDEIRNDNTWLFFTSGAQYPPNWDSLLRDISNKRSEYLSLWNGKSSHFKVLFHANEFDFTKNSLETDSKESLSIASRVINDFAPAHSIPITTADLEVTDDNTTSSVPLSLICFNKLESLRTVGSAGLSRYGTSSVLFNSYKRVIASSLPNFSRQDSNSLTDSLFLNANTVGVLPRRDHRRRNFKFTLPRDGFYTRTGFNMPVSFQNTSSTFLPLGLIPSSLTYTTITNYSSIPDIYNSCENLNSKNKYYGFYVSNTFACRGWYPLGSNAKTNLSSADKYFDLGQLPDIIAVMHYIKEQAKLLEASAYYSTRLTEYSKQSKWKNLLQSYANSSTEFSGNFPNSFDDYTNFSFGKDFHKFYSEYTHNFNRHRLTQDCLNLDGPTIFGHTFGSILTNSKFTKFGNILNLNPNFITTSLDNIYEIGNNDLLFNANGSGSYVASSINDMYVDTYEYRNSGILSHIEFCQTSSTSYDNNFSILNLNKSKTVSELLSNNILIRQKHVNGLGRLRFDISKYLNSSDDGFDTSTNFLTPEHEFKFNIKTLVSDNDAVFVGGSPFAVWIHTKPENGKVWSYLNNKGWVQHLSNLDSNTLVTNYCNVFNDTARSASLDVEDPVKRLKCLKIKNNPVLGSNVLNYYNESHFLNLEILFNTKNLNIDIPKDYPQAQVHRFDQKYVIEIIPLVFDKNKFILYHKLNLIDLTLNKLAKPLIISNPDEYRVELSRSQVLTILKYFNELAGAYNNFGYASRLETQTSSVYESKGGSRINYVESPDWSAPAKIPQTELIYILNIKD